MNIVMLGGPETGKTSYAAVLYGGLVAEAYEQIKYVDLHDEVGVFSDDLDRLAERKSVVRSETNHAGRLGITVEHGDANHDFTIPDRSGEALKESVNGRQWHAQLVAELKKAEGLMLFFSPLKVDRGLSTDAIAAEPTADEGDSIPKPWQESMMPTDVRTVDVLQELDQFPSPRPIPVAVVVSAWDLSKHEKPRDWVARSIPLLDQFLKTHQEAFPSAIFGVSVQGSAFAEGEEVAADEPDPWDRASAVDADGAEVELCTPLSWILQLSASHQHGE